MKVLILRQDFIKNLVTSLKISYVSVTCKLRREHYSVASVTTNLALNCSNRYYYYLSLVRLGLDKGTCQSLLFESLIDRTAVLFFVDSFLNAVVLIVLLRTSPRLTDHNAWRYQSQHHLMADTV